MSHSFCWLTYISCRQDDRTESTLGELMVFVIYTVIKCKSKVITERNINVEKECVSMSLKSLRRAL